jgi:HlyD family secretion protein
MSRRYLLLATLVLVAAAAGGWYYLQRSAAPAPATSQPALSTTQLVRTDITTRHNVAGTLGYGGAVQVLAGGAGTLTWVAPPGSTLGRGAAIYEVDGARVRLLFGDRPAWRAFTPGMTPGDDVLQLERNLNALGYTGFTVDRTYTMITANAVRRWQADLDVTPTGTLPLGSVVFTSGPLRVGVPITPVGGRIAPGNAVLAATSAARAVSVALPTTQRAGVAVGDVVYVSLPDATRMTARITDIGRVASASSNSSGATAAGSGGATVPVTITLDPLPAGATDPTVGLDQAPVQVAIITQRHTGVLAVPVTALVSATSGGYQLVIVTGTTRHQITVTPGLLDEITELIEVTGTDLAPGQQVQVPAP